MLNVVLQLVNNASHDAHEGVTKMVYMSYVISFVKKKSNSEDTGIPNNVL
jgi:hypothetical protein